MTYGINVTNNSGFTQIDENFTNYLVHSTGVVVSGQPIFIPGTDENFSVFFRPVDRTGLKSVYQSVYQDARQVILRSIGDIEYAICLNATELTEPDSEYGLNVYTSGGELAYSSSYKVARVKIRSFDQPLNYTTWVTSGMQDYWALAEPYNRLRGIWTSSNGGIMQVTTWTCLFDYNNDEIRNGESLLGIYGSSGPSWDASGLYRTQMAAII